MAHAALIQNLTEGPLTLPLPLQGVLPPGGSIIVAESAATVLALFNTPAGQRQQVNVVAEPDDSAVTANVGSLDMLTFKVVNVGAPTAGTDAANKTYADTISTGDRAYADALPKSVNLLAGTLAGGAGVTSGFMQLSPDSTAMAATARRFGISGARKTLSLIVQVSANTMAVGTTTFAVFKNGVITALTLAVTAGSTGQFTAAGVVSFADNDQFDVQATNPGGGGGNSIVAVASVGWTN